MKRETAKKMLTLVLCVLFIAVMFCSATFVLTHTRHVHDHAGSNGNCVTCVYVAVAGNLLKFLTGALAGVSLGVWQFAAIRSNIKAACTRAALFTLVHQKIQLNI